MEYTFGTVETFPSKYVDEYDYVMHCLAYFLACGCILLLMVFLAAVVVLGFMFSISAAEFLSKRLVGFCVSNWRRP